MFWETLNLSSWEKSSVYKHMNYYCLHWSMFWYSTPWIGQALTNCFFWPFLIPPDRVFPTGGMGGGEYPPPAPGKILPNRLLLSSTGWLQGQFQSFILQQYFKKWSSGVKFWRWEFTWAGHQSKGGGVGLEPFLACYMGA